VEIPGIHDPKKHPVTYHSSIYSRYAAGLHLFPTKKDILSVPLILNHIPLFGVWSTMNRYSACVEEGSVCVHWI